MDSPNKEEEKPVKDFPESEKKELMVDSHEAEVQKARPLRLVLVGVSFFGTITQHP